MATRELLVVILNHTNEELEIEPQSPSLGHGLLMAPPDLQPPQTILAGESGMMRCKSSHIGGGVDGSIVYRIIGFEQRNKVKFVWSVPYLGVNKFDSACASPEFKVDILGGRGHQAVIVFVFKPAEKANPTSDNGALAAAVKYPLECVEAPVGSLTHH
ncbi:uncharacterized protein FTOL_04519 [Fusarium torulosum]|uniref:Uncharacterized protein n=1 Tax=Fusarium torulosum TaxID=33205 RepID=A0AAE8SG68_9HYPO|nr:uncharacterized protein FTOL_04519 [Fusarium torulosum]